MNKQQKSVSNFVFILLMFNGLLRGFNNVPTEKII